MTSSVAMALKQKLLFSRQAQLELLNSAHNKQSIVDAKPCYGLRTSSARTSMELGHVRCYSHQTTKNA